jgi:hypothetical protein
MLVLVIVAILGIVSATREQRFEPVDVVHRVVSPEELPPSGSRDPLAAPVAHKPGRVVLDVTWGSFTIRRGPPGEPIRLEGKYDVAGFDLEESYEPSETNGWTYRLKFKPRGLQFTFNDNNTNRLRLTIPEGVPFSLEGKIGTGESVVDLGGLWVTDVDLKVGTGSHRFSFEEPTPVPLERFRIDAGIGELRVRSLGNASPATVDISHSIGQIVVDLRGAWQRDADVVTSCGIGECEIRVPRDVGIEVVKTLMFIGESNVAALRDAEPEVAGAPTLRLSLSGRIGEMRVRR